MVGPFLAAWSGAAVISTVDPVWATPVNTFLLMLTAIVGVLINRRVKRVEQKAHDIHQDVGHAANAAAAAASAAADSARIAKELGGQVRHVDTTGATGTTDAGV